MRPDPGNRHPGEPPPHAAQGFDWASVGIETARSFAPSEPVTVVVCGEPSAALAAALAQQAYPAGLVEVVAVSANGRAPDGMRAVRVPAGAGAAAARNAGARAARHGILVFLAADAVPGPGLVAAHARWHHAVADAVTLWRPPPGPVGGPAQADAEPAARDVYLAAAGGGFGMRRRFYTALGGSDEAFADAGAEVELLFRAHAHGALAVPVCVRDGRSARAVQRAAARLADRAPAGLLASRVAWREFRVAAAPAVHAVPRHVVTLVPGDATAARAAALAEAVLADPAGDVAVRIETALDAPAASVRWLEEYFEAEPRVRVAPLLPALDEFPASPVQVRLPVRGTGREPLSAMLKFLGGRAAGARGPDGGGAAVAARSWLLHREGRLGIARPGFATVAAAPVTPVGGDGAEAVRAGPGPGERTLLRRALVRALGVRGPRSAARLVRWAAAGAARRLRGLVRRLRRWWGGRREAAVLRRVLRRLPCRNRVRRWAAGRGPGAGGRYVFEADARDLHTRLDGERSRTSLGAEIAVCGRVAAAGLAASARTVAAPDGDRHVDLVVADTAALAAGLGVPAVCLDDAPPMLSVPAFDPAQFNPAGWLDASDGPPVAFGPPAAVRGAPAGTVHATLADRRALRCAHHLEDTAALHASAVARAAVLVRAAALGVPVRLADGGVGLEALLGAELHAALGEDLRGADAEARERASVRARRAALADHALRSRARQLCAAAGLADPPAPPTVSVLLATRRPGFLRWALANVSRQNYPHLELVLALHGDGFGADAVAAALDGLTVPVQVVRVAAEHPLGTVLNVAAAAARGALVTKMDDDDAYGEHHVRDLVLAREYAGAMLVGKRVETVYWAAEDVTTRVRFGWSRGNERVVKSMLSGGCLLLAREDLARLGGWRRVDAGEDLGLIEDARRVGRVYRTHAFGYVMVRHGDRHAWTDGDAALRGGVTTEYRGFRPEVADIPDCPPPPMAVGAPAARTGTAP